MCFSLSSAGVDFGTASIPAERLTNLVAGESTTLPLILQVGRQSSRKHSRQPFGSGPQ